MSAIMGRALFAFGLLLLLVLLPALPVQAGEPAVQTELRGRALDTNRAAVVGARVVALRNGTEVTSVVTNAQGDFSLLLEPGEYVLRISAPGFSDVEQTIKSKPTNFEPLEVVLQVEGFTGTVTVTDMAGYNALPVSSATRTLTPLRDVPQSVSVITRDSIKELSMQSIADVVRYVPGVTAVQGESNRDQIVIRGTNTTADFFVDGVRDDAQYFRDLYNVDRFEALKGPNAMVFGRGGGGGVLNRVTKQAAFASFGDITLQGGSENHKRALGDFGQVLNDRLAFRFNGVYENSGSFRDGVDLERFGLNPTATVLAGKDTTFRFGYEHFQDKRVADRGIPSFSGAPLDIDNSTFFGNPNESPSRATVNLLSGSFEHQIGRVNIRNRTLLGDYDKFYQNFVPGTVNADATRVSISAYNNATHRRNLFNQTDISFTAKTGSVRHTFLTGAELGRQVSRNFRRTGFFNNTTSTFSADLANPTIDIPVTFRQNATDADNRVRAIVAAGYVQDQIELSRKVQVLLGVRFDRFDLDFHNNRNGEDLGRLDNLVSPRAGLVFKPVAQLSLYTSYSVSYLPSSGDQFSSLTTVTQTLKPEKFNNYEVGAKWDIRDSLSLTAAAYRLDLRNTRATDPNDPTRIVQTGSQRTNGFELSLNGSITRDWKVLGGYTYQDAYVSSATISAPRGARVAQVPKNTFSLWNNYRFSSKFGGGLGIVHRSDMFAGIDNRVVLPGYTRADAAFYFNATESVSLQANFENLFDTDYFVNAHSNDNISPGAPRAIRVALNWRF
ncbi:MAG TPA: TonB-dependent siderophore receptor [Pyrinomonadaceae bacterium]|nr:TonB-dependent siderophore receptor [Pyrinomonadaceae bacterium]